MQVKKLTNDISYILDALRDSTVLEVQVVIVHCALAFNFIAYIKYNEYENSLQLWISFFSYVKGFTYYYTVIIMLLCS